MEPNMTAKEKVQQVISKMPEESTIDDIQYHLYVLQCIEQGEKEIEEGETLTQAEVKSRLSKWLIAASEV
jgi:predicted transcriptional regulator